LERRLLPVGRVVAADRFGKLAEDLASSDFATRQRAAATIVAFGEAARPLLLKEHHRSKDLELHLRLEQLLAQLSPRSPDRLREVRAVMALERCATPEARQLLRRLANGLPEALLTRQAKAALARLQTRK
jgi:hypothetical protein